MLFITNNNYVFNAVSQDFIVAEGVAVFRTGQTVSSVTLIINDDLRVETTERFLLVASLNSNEGNAISIINQAEFSIQDNDSNLIIKYVALLKFNSPPRFSDWI